ncbi:hypothetical protein C4X99_01410 [Leptospira interrogans serovar Geyaweera]|uniref:hypothetical protein n=1 Tax=Leptospira interrogans TaxID=173 RepID=UPI00122C3F09|nr:hypothetical protein [Leptospira interrogans]KAA1293765.1 hypothetical protein C4X99_01410 [Leptospira interrogans serovar Geyaweera]UML86420.1 hypothetical protein FH587_13530 [Leptospira interrogans]
MDMNFTYDELRELRFLAWKKRTELGDTIDLYAGYGGVYEKLTEQVKKEFELFKGLEAKLEKLKDSAPI